MQVNFETLTVVAYIMLLFINETPRNKLGTLTSVSGVSFS